MAAAAETPAFIQRGGEALDAHQALQVLLFLPPKSAGRVQAAAKTSILARSAGSDALWAAHARSYFGLCGPGACRGPRGEASGASWAKAFRMWQGSVPDASFEALAGARVHGPLRARWIAVWSRVRQWLGAHAPEVARTLRAPLTAGHEGLLADHDVPEAHPAVLGLWCVHDGQDAPMGTSLCARLGMRGPAEDEEWSRGLLGGYTVYSHEVSMVLLPLRAALSLTQFFRERMGLSSPDFRSRLAFASSYNYLKFFFVDVEDGSVWAWTGRPRRMFERAIPLGHSGLSRGSKVRLSGLQARPELNDREGTLVDFDAAEGRWQVRMEDGSGVQLLKEDNLRAEAALAQAQDGDGLLRWFEEFASRLDGGIYRKMPLRPDQASSDFPTEGICLFPASGPEFSHCVTQGVEVTASCVYMPEDPQSGWTYSIAMRLVGTAEERGFKTCQLDVRHWVIQEDGSDPEHVRGKGVVGFFPILDDGGWWLNQASDPNLQYGIPHGFVEGAFRYQSCSGRSRSMKGSFSGDLTFVPGTREKPTGPPFQARLEKFHLRVPDYIF